MSVARETGALVMVHAENYDAIRFLIDRLERGGHVAPKFHGDLAADPRRARGDASRDLARRDRRRAGDDRPRLERRGDGGDPPRARSRGLKVYGETCPQYLVLTEKDMDGLNMEGAKYVCSPPPRDTASQQACWEGLQNGVFDVFSSDHCPFRYDDPAGKLNPKGRTSLPLGAQRHSRRRDAAADPVLGRRRKGPDHLNRFVAL